MSRLNECVRRLCAPLGRAAFLALGLALTGGAALAQSTVPPPQPPPAPSDSNSGTNSGTKSGTKSAKSGSQVDTQTTEKAGPKKSGETGSVKANVKQLGREVSDPGTLQRIKAHEQEFETNVQRNRARQRKDHGAARPSDAVDLAKSLDKPAGAAAAPGAKNKTETTPAPAALPPPPPAAAKTTPAR